MYTATTTATTTATAAPAAAAGDGDSNSSDDGIVAGAPEPVPEMLQLGSVKPSRSVYAFGSEAGVLQNLPPNSVEGTNRICQVILLTGQGQRFLSSCLTEAGMEHSKKKESSERESLASDKDPPPCTRS